LFEAPGALAFSAAGLVARMPISMIGIGAVLLISTADGRFGVAGAVAATYALVQAACAPLLGRLVDRLGQGRVAVPSAVVSATGLLGLMFSVLESAPVWTYFLSAAIAGAAVPNIGSLVRARWAAIYTGTSRLHTAYSVESVIDELIFVIGPPLVTVLTIQVARAAGMLTAVAFLVIGTVILGSLHGTEPAPSPKVQRGGGGRSVFRIAGIRVLVAVFAGLGCMFGSAEVITVAFARERGHPGAAGVLLGLYAFGSLVAGLIFGARRPLRPLWQRLLVGLAGMVVTAIPWLIISDLAWFAAAMVVAGLAISPTLITGFALAEFLVPPERLTEGLAVESTGLALGITIGSAAAGYLIDSVGAHHAYFLSLASGLAAFAIGVAGRASLAQPGVSRPPASDGEKATPDRPLPT